MYWYCNDSPLSSKITFTSLSGISNERSFKWCHCFLISVFSMMVGAQPHKWHLSSSPRYRVPGTVWGQRASHSGGPLGFDCLQGGARHPQLQGRGPTHSQHRVVQRWRACGDWQRRPAVPPHAPAQRLPLLPAHRTRATEQTGRGHLHLRGPQPPGRRHQSQCFTGSCQ